MAAALLFRQHILSLLFGQIESDVMDSALVYFLTTALAYPFISLYNAGAALFRSMGNSKVSMFNSLIVNLVNVVVNAVLIYGFHMGSLGAGIGTLVSRVAAAVIILYLLQHHNNVLRIEGFSASSSGDMVGRILTIGIPNGLENGLFQTGKLVVLSLITSFGTNAVAANAIEQHRRGGQCPRSGHRPGHDHPAGAKRMGAQAPEQAVSDPWKLVGIVYLAMGSLALLMFILRRASLHLPAHTGGGRHGGRGAALVRRSLTRRHLAAVLHPLPNALRARRATWYSPWRCPWPPCSF